MDINFKDTDIPETSKVGRKPLPNPFADIFPLDDKAKTFTIAEPKDSPEARRIVRQVRAAAKAVDRTGRVEFTEGDKETTVTVWTVKAVRRAPKAEPSTDLGRAAVQKAAKGGQPKA